MTHIELIREGNRTEISILGHADYCAQGPDIVCAAVSTLSGTFVQCLNDLEEDGKLWLYEADVLSGCVKIKVEPKGEAIKQTNQIIDVIMTGYLLLENKYKDYVHVTQQE